MSSKIVIAIQRKGRLFDDSKNLLIRSGVNFSTSGEKLLARSSNLDIDILLVRDDDIPSLVSKGVANLGIVGQNVLAEQVATNKKITAKTVLNLGFSRCKLAFAKPLNSKLRSLKNKTIATSYPALVKKYLKNNEINAEVIKINGSVELTPYIGIADCICDLVSSGATLEANNLIEFKSLMESEAVLISPVESKKITQTNIINLIKRFDWILLKRHLPDDNLIEKTILKKYKWGGMTEASTHWEFGKDFFDSFGCPTHIINGGVQTRSLVFLDCREF